MSQQTTMASITFKLASGSIKTIDIAPGTTLMEGAVRGGVDGIDADCGGALSCATCHVRIAPEWCDRLENATEAELDMLEFAVNAGKGSRLSCQVVIEDSLEGLTVYVPETQHA